MEFLDLVLSEMGMLLKVGRSLENTLLKVEA